jgi:Rrf2 family protein
MLSQTVEYALRAVVYLAGEKDGLTSTAAVAKATKVPPAYLAKVLRALVKAGIVTARRGIGGGMTLAKDPARLTILVVVNAVDPIKRITTCPLNLAAHGARLCPLHKRMDAALALVEKTFGSTTLAEVLAEPSRSETLCDFPAVQPLKVKGRK